MSSTSAADRVSHWLVVNSRNNGSLHPPRTAEERKHLVGWSLADTTIFGTNAVASVSPAAVLVGGATAAWGVGRMLLGLLRGLSFCSTDDVGPAREMKAGAALALGGLSCALLPGPVGLAINGALASWSAAETWAAHRHTER